VDDKKRKNPEHEMDVTDKQANESYAEHLARVMPDADNSKALLQAHYKALHHADPD
jgi:hypothetical protein